MSKRPAPLAKSAPRASLLSRGSREHRKTATTGSSASHWALLSGRCVGMAVVALLLLALVSIAVYVISVHRLRGIGDVVTVLAVLRQETASDGRCKSHPKATAPSQTYRCLPNVFLIGASKSGTTSLTDYLAHHGSLRDNFVQRRIYDSDDGHREVHRFDRDTYAYSSALLEIGDEWASSPVVTDTVAPVFHYTPHYLYAPTVPFDLRRLYPPQASDALRFIVLLRNPVERALSSYWFHNSKLLNHRVDRGSIGDFIEAARAEMRTRKLYDSCVRERLLGSDTAAAARAVDEAGGAGVLGVVAPLLRRASDALLEAALSLSGGAAPASGSGVAQKNATHFQGALYGCFGRESLRSSSLGHRHVDKGIYHDQLYRWFVNFPQRRFLIVLFEDFAARPQVELRRILRFTGLPEAEAASLQGIDFSKVRLSKPNTLFAGNSSGLPESFRHELYSFYRPYNRKLEVLLKRSLSQWDLT